MGGAHPVTQAQLGQPSARADGVFTLLDAVARGRPKAGGDDGRNAKPPRRVLELPTGGDRRKAGSTGREAATGARR